jgi:peptide/nickel transport system permease protein
MDYAGRFFSILFLAIPNFWLGTLIVLALVLTFQWKAPLQVINIWENPWQNLQIVWGPALVLGIGQAAYVSRMARSALLETIHEDYIRTARAKGLAERIVIARHALRNAIMPVITLSGVLLGFLIGGSVAVEQAFGVPGLGRTLVFAFLERDYVVIQNLVLLYGIIFVVTNLLVDVSYAWIDPRIRYS